MNLAVSFSRFGKASEVAELVDRGEVAEPGPGEITVAVSAAPIDPGHLLAFEGKYGLPTTSFPSYAGNQASGIVAATGAEVIGLKVGDLVLLGDGQRGSWSQRLTVRADHVVAVPDVDPVQLSFVLSTLTTAYCLLTVRTRSSAGDWIIQNTGNSAVGLQVARLARHLGIHVASIVRSEAAAKLARAHGAEVVLLQGDPDWKSAILDASGGVLPRLAFDAMAGSAVGDLARCLADDGTITSYGVLTGQPFTIDTASVLFRGISLQGFWRSRWAASLPRQETHAVYARVAALLASGVFEVPVEARYGIRDIHAALEHAARPGRSRKIVLLPNG